VNADKVIGIFMAFIFLTALSVVISNRANTAKVLDALFKGFSSVQRAAVSPVTGK
jgi:hypothetical protein